MTEEVEVRVVKNAKQDVSEVKAPGLMEKSSLIKTKKKNGMSDTSRHIILILVKITFFIGLLYVVFFVVFGITRMEEYNMYPAVKDGDLLIYYRMENQFENGDVVVVEQGGKEMVMRIIASGGQEVDINDENSLSVDGQPATFQAFYETPRADEFGFRYPYRVSKDCYFMLNDYRSNTNDSRAFGEVCHNKIKGRLITKIQIRDL